MGEVQTVSLQTAMATLYRHEINCGISCFWDGGWDVWIGDEMNGRRAETNLLPGELDQAGSWLLATAMRLFPMFAWREEHVEPLLDRATSQHKDTPNE